MRSISTRVDDETHATIAEVAEERGISMSAVVRELIDDGLERDRLEAEIERLRNEKRVILAQRQEHTELVEYVEQERELKERRERRESAPAWTRARYWLFGVPDPNSASGGSEKGDGDGE